jgi:hypothetical protein
MQGIGRATITIRRERRHPPWPKKGADVFTREAKMKSTVYEGEEYIRNQNTELEQQVRE